jgi:murein DD-endopeptidase MepM/ murein hydrolase activator NlpD
MAYIVAGLTLLLSATIILRLYFKHYRNGGQFVFHLIGSLCSAGFIFFIGGWAYISFYVRWIFLLIFLLVLVFSILKMRRSGATIPGLGSWYYVLFRSLFTIIIGLVMYLYFAARHYPGEVVNLRFPFRHGEYYVMQGGANRLSNPAHRNYSKAKYGFAMDISKLYSNGNRATGIMPMDVKDYAIYSDTVLSPCSGKVIRVVDTVHTNLPGQYNIKNVHGNHVIIQAKGYRVFLAHFIKGKVFVKEGDIVRTGFPLGLAGNSGFSAEPHLHINVLEEYDTIPYDNEQKIKNRSTQAQNLIYDDFRYSGISSPFQFDGHFYIINDIIRR